MTAQLPLPLDRELPKPSYYNTTGLKNPELMEKRKKVVGQSAEILHIFANNPRVAFTAWNIYDKVQCQYPITSVRRAISNLVKMKFLEYTGKVKVSGPYSEDCKLVRLNPNHL